MPFVLSAIFGAPYIYCRSRHCASGVTFIFLEVGVCAGYRAPHARSRSALQAHPYRRVHLLTLTMFPRACPGVCAPCRRAEACPFSSRCVSLCKTPPPSLNCRAGQRSHICLVKNYFRLRHSTVVWIDLGGFLIFVSSDTFPGRNSRNHQDVRTFSCPLVFCLRSGAWCFCRWRCGRATSP